MNFVTFCVCGYTTCFMVFSVLVKAITLMIQAWSNKALSVQCLNSRTTNNTPQGKVEVIYCHLKCPDKAASAKYPVFTRVGLDNSLGTVAHHTFVILSVGKFWFKVVQRTKQLLQFVP